VIILHRDYATGYATEGAEGGAEKDVEKPELEGVRPTKGVVREQEALNQTNGATVCLGAIVPTRLRESLSQ
jgi:hypothetical protein